MAFGDDTLIESVEERVRGSALLNAKVTLAGRVQRDEMPNYYGAADVFVSGSHSEGSGYALIEAMSAGVVPVVTDIPSFRAIVGDDRSRWAPGDAADCARVLLEDVRVRSRRAASRGEGALQSGVELGCDRRPHGRRIRGARAFMKIAIVVPGGLHPSGQEQVVPSWLALFERLAKSHQIHAFALKHLEKPQSYSLRGFTVHDLGRPSAPLGLTRLGPGAGPGARARSARSVRSDPRFLRRSRRPARGARRPPPEDSKRRHLRQRRVRVDCEHQVRLAADGPRPACRHRSVHARDQGARVHELHGRARRVAEDRLDGDPVDVGDITGGDDQVAGQTAPTRHVSDRPGRQPEPRQEPAAADRRAADRSREDRRAARSRRRGHAERRAAEACGGRSASART